MKAPIMKQADYDYLGTLRKPPKTRGTVMKGHITELKAISLKLVKRLYMNYQPINPGKIAAVKMDKARRKIIEAIKILEDVG